MNNNVRRFRRFRSKYYSLFTFNNIIYIISISIIEMSGDKIKLSTNENVYFMIGRFQPPTRGHIQMIFNMTEMAEKDADVYVFATSTQDSIKNPLHVSDKIEYLKKSYEFNKLSNKLSKEVRFINTTTCLKEFGPPIQGCKHLFAIIDVLLSAGYTKLNLCVGSDRVKSFTNTFEKYKKPSGIHIKVISLGERNNSNNTDISNISKISGTKMRTLAMSGNLEYFKKGTILPNNSAKLLMKLIQNRTKEQMNKSKTNKTAKSKTNKTNKTAKSKTAKRKRSISHEKSPNKSPKKSLKKHKVN